MSNLFKHAPVELSCQLLSAVMEKNYGNALAFCQAALIFEPDNEIYKQYEKILKEAKIKEEELETDSENELEADDENETDNDSEANDADSENESEDSGNSSSSDIDDKNNESSSDSNTESESDEEEFSPQEICKLNLLLGGLKVK